MGDHNVAAGIHGHALRHKRCPVRGKAVDLVRKLPWLSKTLMRWCFVSAIWILPDEESFHGSGHEDIGPSTSLGNSVTADGFLYETLNRTGNLWRLIRSSPASHSSSFL
jgi:hypothetical protein